MAGEGGKNLVVARQDGNIEVYVTELSGSLSISATTFVYVSHD